MTKTKCCTFGEVEQEYLRNHLEEMVGSAHPTELNRFYAVTNE
jgi:hypothetical protein